MVILVWNFYTDAVAYNPLKEAVLAGEKAPEKEETKFLAQSGAWGKEIAEKNLFSQRRGVLPPPPPPVMISPRVETPRPQRPALGLKGIILDQFGDYVALIEKDGAKPVPLRKGDNIDGVSVMDVDARNVKLRWNDEDIRLSMEKIRTIKR